MEELCLHCLVQHSFNLSKPLVLVLGAYPNNVVTPTCVPKVYLQMAEILGLPPLKTNITLTNFRTATKLDLSINLK